MANSVLASIPSWGDYHPIYRFGASALLGPRGGLFEGVFELVSGTRVGGLEGDMYASGGSNQADYILADRGDLGIPPDFFGFCCFCVRNGASELLGDHQGF